MNYDINSAKKQVEYLDNLRFERAISGSSTQFNQVFQTISLLLHLNHHQLPGYIENAPAGIVDFVLSDYQREYLSARFDLSEQEIENSPFSHRTFFPVLGVYVMGSIASISQTSVSDLDIWVCHHPQISPEDRHLLSQKMEALQQWALTLGVEINLYLMDQNRFRCFRYADPLTAENCGSAQYMLLLDEFYRSAIRLAGKPLLWLHLAVENEKDYENEVARLIEEKVIDPDDWVDFGGLGAFSANEYFGASLWQLYKGIDSPYKSVLKILLLETYSADYPDTYLIAQEFKARLLNGDKKHHFDPYLTMLERVTNYLIGLNDLRRLEFVRRCFYIKANEYSNKVPKNTWRLSQLQNLARTWGWSKDLVQELNQRACWKIKRVKESHNNLIKFLMFSYRHLVQFARKYKVNSSIMPQDISILTRKLYTAFEELPGKITLLNAMISSDLSEKNITFIEVKNNRNFKDGWYLVNQTPDIRGFQQQRYVEYSENLNKLVAWAYFNRLLTPKTELHIFSPNVDLHKLRHFVADLRLSLPAIVPVASNEELNHNCEIKNLVVSINLTKDPTAHLSEAKASIVASDLFSFGPDEESLVGSIDLTYRNLWNEIRTLHFEGPNAILLALKVLSNKIYRGATSPQSVNVFCYSKYYQKNLRNIVTALIQKCISIQVGVSDAPQNNLLRVAGKNWQFFFEERGISLQEIHNPPLIDNNDFNVEVQELIEHKEKPQARKKYPYEIDAFASEGFLQFFFENNLDHTFNVYILDEANRIEIYRNCEGEKEQKIYEINHIYQSAGLEGDNNPYKIVQRNFNYPQFYQLLPSDNGIKIVPFYSRLVSS
ncbi:class I adenylate cyclase [Avibacterium gallinarum]|uniref:Adenylate cyclase n=1 Tax=Avibacterium gallinarum TaxID=755 RepID=A0A379AZH8_AVIGA|nr:class I adenylate cyclase [Avibacterium gallinarum]POY44159.1 class I adenylate cyclase [Avibacterium gallinarum]TDP29316.1 adenylate cyclase class 1 [Avibacterium gallinarum]SUB28113.1 adenylate cyclase [Avibacterium gallinarum]